MSTTIQYKEEGKDIIKKVENLTPWDRAEIIKYLAERIMSWEEFEAYFLEGSGYVKEEDIDPVKEVIDNGDEREVLESMYEDDICDYLLDSSSIEYYLRYILEKMRLKDIGDAISRIDKTTIECIIDELEENHYEDYVKLKNYINSNGESNTKD